MRSSFILAVTCATLVLAACDGGDGHDSPESTQPTTVASNLDPNRQPPAPEIDGATPGGTVTVHVDSGLETMDPTESYYLDTTSILAGLVTRSLTQYVYDPSSDSMILVPDIATDLGRPNDNYTKWTYTIRPGVKFEDGTEVTADDVAFGIERSFDRKTFPLGATYSNDYFLHGDTYKGPYRSGTYDGIVVNGNTLTLKMAKPFPDMPYWGAFPAIGPIPRDSDPRTYKLHPMATGPYKFDGHVSGKSLTLVRNPEWDPTTDPGRHDYPDRYEFQFKGDASKIGQAILGGVGDAQTTLSYDIPPADLLNQALSEAPDLVTTGPTPCVSVLSLDYRAIPDPRVRQAIGYAFPFTEWLKAREGIIGVTSNPGRTLIPPGTSGRRDYNPLSTAPGHTDPDKAKSLLAEARLNAGEFRLRFAYDSNDPLDVATKDVLVAGFEAGGFAVDPFKTSSSDELNAVQKDPNAPVNIRFTGWCSDWPSGNASILPLLSSKASDPTNFFTYFHNHEVDATIERIDELPLADQPAAWGALDQKIETDYYPIVVTQHRLNAMLHGSRIGGMNSDTLMSMPTWKDIYVLQ